MECLDQLPILQGFTEKHSGRCAAPIATGASLIENPCISRDVANIGRLIPTTDSGASAA